MASTLEIKEGANNGWFIYKDGSPVLGTSKKEIADSVLPFLATGNQLDKILSDFLIDVNKKGTIGRGKYIDIAKDFLKTNYGV